MKISLNWLKEFVSIRVSAKELAHRLTMAGLEVEAVEEKGGDTFFTLGITPNRGDCLSVIGVAREVGALGGIKNQKSKIKKISKGENPIGDFMKVKVLDKKGCPRYMARAITGVRIAPSPQWMAQRLENAGVRPVNNVVDCTNYVLLELGHPLHAFDQNFLRGKEIIVRRERESVHFTTLDGVARLCQPEDLFICDAEGPVAIAGIMGGANSEIRPETTTVILEAAAFDPQRIHRSAKRLNISSESSYRFERGVDPNGVPGALHRVTELIVETAGGVPSKDWVDIYPTKRRPKIFSLPLSEIERMLGVTIHASEVKKLLEPYGFECRKKSPALIVTAPTFRTDVSRPIDLVEEVARSYGLDKIPATLPKIQMNSPLQLRHRDTDERAVETLLGLGYSEACHLVFTTPAKAKIFEPHEDFFVPLENPLSEDHKILRPALFPLLLDALAFNLHRQRGDIKLFELGKVFCWNKNGLVEKCAGPASHAAGSPQRGHPSHQHGCHPHIFQQGQNTVRERRHLSLVASGREWGLQWQLKTKPVDFYSLKGTLRELAPVDFVLKEELPSFLKPSQACWVYLREKKVGWVGQLQNSILKNLEIEEAVFGAEIDWDIFEEDLSAEVCFKSISKFPFVERDIALVVDGNLPAKTIEEAIRKEENPWIQQVKLFDIFNGGNLPKNKKSLALNICYASSERTLTNEEVNRAHETLIAHLEVELQAQLRK